MSKYADIIERLEKATGPDRELDAQVWFNANPVDLEIEDADFNESGGVKVWVLGAKNPHWVNSEKYTASIDAALALVERMLPGWWWLREDGVSIRLVGPDNNDYYPSSIGIHHLVPTAILLALFRALEAKEQS